MVVSLRMLLLLMGLQNGDSYIKFIIKYACNEVGLEFEEKEVTSQVQTNEVCLAGELNDDDVQKKIDRKRMFQFS